MSGRSITIDHDGVSYDGVMATIRSTMLGNEDHGIFTAYLHCEWPGGGVGVGGFGLDTPLKDADGRFLRREGSAYGLDHLMRVMETVGVSKWEALPGKHVIVLFAAGKGAWGGTSLGIAHPTDEKKVLVLKEHAEEWHLRAAEDEMEQAR